MQPKLRIAIDCRIEDPRQGMGTAVRALAKAFAESKTETQEYFFIVHKGMEDWFAPSMGGPCRIVSSSPPALNRWKQMFRWLAPLRWIWRKTNRILATIPVSDGFIEEQRFDVVHFAVATPYVTKIPSLYQIHDLQFRHFPEFYTKENLAVAERYAGTFCAQATLICVHTEWSKQDLITQFGVSPEKIVVIPWGCVTDVHAPLNAEAFTREKEALRLPEQFLYFPASAWPHKNHEIIFRALKLLKEVDGLQPHLYLTGMKGQHYAALEELAKQLGVDTQIHHLGFVEPEALQALYRSATALVYPSHFEGFGLPLLEAFHFGLPVICSNTSVLPEVGGDAALYFDPNDERALAECIKTVFEDGVLRSQLSERGAALLKNYSFSKTAAAFQLAYERISAEKAKK